MIKFEIGKVYGIDANVYEVIKKTAKTITYQEIAHYGRSNEKRYEPKRAKLFNWDTREVFSCKWSSHNRSNGTGRDLISAQHVGGTICK